MQKDVEPLAHALELGENVPPQLRNQAQDLEPVPPNYLFKLFSHAEKRVLVQQVAWEELNASIPIK